MTTDKFYLERLQTRMCILSSMLFNILHLEPIFREALENEDVGIQVNGKLIPDLRYPDDTAIVTEPSKIWNSSLEKSN